MQKTDKEMQNLVAMSGGMTSYNGIPIMGYSMSMNNLADNTIKSKGLSVQSDWQLGENNYLIAGAGFDIDELEANTFNDIHVTGMMPGDTPAAVNVRPATITDVEGSQKQYYVFLSNETLLPHDFAANYGVRWTYVRTEMDKVNGVYADNAIMEMGDTSMSLAGRPASGRGEVGDESNSRAVFNFGLTWRGIDDLALRATWAQGFRAPTLQEKFLTNSMGGGTEMGNPDLKPETSNNFELGARYMDDRLMLDAAAFLSLADDYITTKDIGGSTYMYDNVGKATTYGLELTASYDLPCGITPYGSVTYLRRQFDWGGQVGKTYDTNTPDFTFRAGVRYVKDFGLWTLHSDLYARGATDRDYEYESSGEVVKTHTAGYTTANIELGGTFGKERQYAITAQVLNLFDKEYYISDALPEAGVHAIVTASAKF